MCQCQQPRHSRHVPLFKRRLRRLPLPQLLVPVPPVPEVHLELDADRCASRCAADTPPHETPSWASVLMPLGRKLIASVPLTPSYSTRPRLGHGTSARSSVRSARRLLLAQRDRRASPYPSPQTIARNLSSSPDEMNSSTASMSVRVSCPHRATRRSPCSMSW